MQCLHPSHSTDIANSSPVKCPLFVLVCWFGCCFLWCWFCFLLLALMAYGGCAAVCSWGSCFVLCAPTSCLTYSSAKKRLPIFETHWLALSILIVTLTKGQESGRADRQCSSSDVSCSGELLLLWPVTGWLLNCDAFAACCMRFGGLICLLDLGAMLPDHGMEVFVYLIAALRWQVHHQLGF